MKHKEQNNQQDLLMPARMAMRNYVPPRGLISDIESSDVSVIIAIILYFIAREPTIGLTKLECYLILLDRKSCKETGRNLFNWRLNKRGRIGSFRKIIEFMIGKNFIFRKGAYQFYILTNASDILKVLQNILSNIKEWLELILSIWGNKTAQETLRDIQKGIWCGDNGIGVTLPIKPLKPFDLSDLHNVIDKNTLEHQRLEVQQTMKKK